MDVGTGARFLDGQAKVFERVKAVVKAYPALAKHVETALKVPESAVREVLEHWSRNKIGLPEWLAPYHTAKVCLRLNHKQGFGCSLADQCEYDHVCMLCTKNKPLHGVFHQNPEQFTYVCQTHQALEKDLADLKVAHGLSYTDVEQFIKHTRITAAPPKTLLNATSSSTPSSSASKPARLSSAHGGSLVTLPPGPPPLAAAAPPPRTMSFAAAAVKGNSTSATALPQALRAGASGGPKPTGAMVANLPPVLQPQPVAGASHSLSRGASGPAPDTPTTPMKATAMQQQQRTAAPLGLATLTQSLSDLKFTTVARSENATLTIPSAAPRRDSTPALTAGAHSESAPTTPRTASPVPSTPTPTPVHLTMEEEAAKDGCPFESYPIFVDDPSQSLVLSMFHKRVIAEGKHSVVVEADWRWDIRGPVPQKVAVKLWQVPFQMSGDDVEKKRKEVDNEIKAIQRLAETSTAVVQMLVPMCLPIRYPNNSPIKFLCMVMKRYGRTLGEFLVDRQTAGQPLVADEWRRLILQLVAAYADCHSCFVAHRDVKPENILTDSSNTNGGDDLPVLRLCDFGCSRLFEDRTSSLMSTKVGTFDRENNRMWIAPEVVRRDSTGYKISADLWSLGCVIYYIPTNGRALFETMEQVTDLRDDDVKLSAHLRRHNLHIEQPLIFDLVARMVKLRADERLKCTKHQTPTKCYGGAVAHPACWSAESARQIVTELVDKANNGVAGAMSLLQALDRDALKALGGVLDWSGKAPPDFVACLDDFQKTRSKSAAAKVPDAAKQKPSQLLRFLRNAFAHFKNYLVKVGASAAGLAADEALNALVASVVRAFPDLFLLIFDLAHSSKLAADVTIVYSNNAHCIKFRGT